ncbi:hypothetical protein [Rhizobium leguminosarum]
MTSLYASPERADDTKAMPLFNPLGSIAGDVVIERPDATSTS